MKYLLLVALILVVGCAAGPSSLQNTMDAQGHDPAGFWLGVWHGCISPVTFLVSLFNPHVMPYEVHNNGSWYNFGFLWGAGALTGGCSVCAKRRKHK